MEHRILIVDDEREIPTVLSMVFQRQGFKVFTAYNGREALMSINTMAFDLILADIEMPELSGFDVLRLVRESRPGTKVVLMTGLADYEEKAREQKCDGFLKKPFSLAELKETIAGLLTRKDRDEAKASAAPLEFPTPARRAPLAHILLVEAIESLARPILSFLGDESKAEGLYQVSHVASKDQAVAAQESFHPDIVVMDMKTVFHAAEVVDALSKMPRPPKDFIFYFNPIIPFGRDLPQNADGKSGSEDAVHEKNLRDLAALVKASARQFNPAKS